MPIQTPHLHLHHHRHAHPPPPPQPPPQFHHPKSNVSESGTRKLLCLLLKCIIMTFILSLFLLFIGFAALVLLHFILLTTATSSGNRRRRRSQRQAHQYYSFSDHVSPYSLKDVENFVPSLSYDAAGESVKDCAICLESFKDGENCRKLPGCNHLFHVICVDTWLVKVPNCPVCRNRVKLDSERVGSVGSEDDWRVWWPVGV